MNASSKQKLDSFLKTSEVSDFEFTFVPLDEELDYLILPMALRLSEKLEQRLPGQYFCPNLYENSYHKRKIRRDGFQVPTYVKNPSKINHDFFRELCMKNEVILLSIPNVLWDLIVPKIKRNTGRFIEQGLSVSITCTKQKTGWPFYYVKQIDPFVSQDKFEHLLSASEKINIQPAIKHYQRMCSLYFGEAKVDENLFQ